MYTVVIVLLKFCHSDKELEKSQKYFENVIMHAAFKVVICIYRYYSFGVTPKKQNRFC